MRRKLVGVRRRRGGRRSDHPSGSRCPARHRPNAAPAEPSTTLIEHVVVLFPENISVRSPSVPIRNAVNGTGNRPSPLLRGCRSTALGSGLLTENRTRPTRRGSPTIRPSPAIRTTASVLSRKPRTTGKWTCSSRRLPAVAAARKRKNKSTYGPARDRHGLLRRRNTVTGLWNYAQHYALNDNSYNNQGSVPSTPGAINLISGDLPKALSRARVTPQTSTVACFRATPNRATTSAPTPPRRWKAATVNGEPVELPGGATAEMTSKNVGDLLNERGVTWGWFQGGFEPSGLQRHSSPVRQSMQNAAAPT